MHVGRSALVLAPMLLATACGSTTSTAGGGAGGASATGGGAGATQAGGSGGAVGASGTGGAAGGGNVGFGSCSAFTPCGGDVTGVWTYTTACADSTAFQGAVQQACATATTTEHGVVSGTLTFSGGRVQRSGTYVVTADIHVPSNCVVVSCAVVQGLLATSLSGVTCSDGAAGSCDCIASRTGGSIASQAYTASGTTITLADGRTFDYCVTGTTLVYRETTANAEPGTYTLSR